MGRMGGDDLFDWSGNPGDDEERWDLRCIWEEELTRSVDSGVRERMEPRMFRCLV